MPQNSLFPGDDDDARQSDSLNDSAADGPPTDRDAGPRLDEFERFYRSQFGAVVSYFARRYDEPQLIADLTADTFVAAIRSFADRDPARTSSRAWAIGIARRLWMRYRESDPRGEDTGRMRSIERLLDRAETKELMWWIDVERSSRNLTERLSRMSVLDREALELVDLCELEPPEAARELGISAAALRVRLLRTRARLSRDAGDDV
jgi:RNA polymerase sigma-70 factor (ECF subfamily)